MFETVKLWLPTEQKTKSAGNSLAHLFLPSPVTCFLQGELGAGKTTFLQGFAEGLGIPGNLTSPTYALEQQYRTEAGVPFNHIDLYRLSTADATRLVDETDPSEGIRCVEWADRLQEIPAGLPQIFLLLEEQNGGRSLRVEFRDVRIPGEEEITAWRNEVKLPENIIAHCETVADVCARLANRLTEQGQLVRTAATVAAARLHDLLRFVDFRDRPNEPEEWELLRIAYAGKKHEQAAAEFLHERGYPGIGDIVLTHGLPNEGILDACTEQKLLYYADKRVAHDKVVSLEERFREFEERYGKAPAGWDAMAYRLEEELFPDGPPL